MCEEGCSESREALKPAGIHERERSVRHGKEASIRRSLSRTSECGSEFFQKMPLGRRGGTPTPGGQQGAHYKHKNLKSLLYCLSTINYCTLLWREPCVSFLKILFLLFKLIFRDRKRNIGISHKPRLRIEPTTWVCTLMGNQTCHLWCTGWCSEPHRPGKPRVSCLNIKRIYFPTTFR